MALAVNDVVDLTVLLRSHPEWLAEVRKLVLTDELLLLPAIVQELANAQKQVRLELDELAHEVKELANAQKQVRLELDELAHEVKELANAQKQLRLELDELAQQVKELARQLKGLAEQVGELVEAQRRQGIRLDGVLGWKLERQIAERAGAYLGRWMRAVVLVDRVELRDTLEAHLAEDEIEDVMRADLLIRGRVRRDPPAAEVLLAFEVSRMVDRNDVARARRRARLIGKAGLLAMPAVAGEDMTEGAREEEQAEALVVLLDGSVRGFERPPSLWSLRGSADPVAG